MTPAPDRRAFLRASVACTVGFAGTRPLSAEPACADALLPQHDPDARGRRRRLERTRSQYVYDYGRVPTLPMVENVPAADSFSLPWIRQGLSRAADLVENFLAGPGARNVGRLRALRRVAETVAGGGMVDGGAAAALIEVARQAAAEAVGPDRPQSLDDYGAIFRTIARPAIADTFQEDHVFARHRVAGPNPLVIRQVGGVDERFPVSDALFRSVLPGDSLNAAGREGRLYLADYRDLAGIETGHFGGVPKHLSAPLALFAVEKGSGELVPIAIQCAQEPGAGNPVFSPHDGHAWLLAKTVVQIADANVHEAVSHLGRTHLFIEPFVIATERQLASHHPLRLLLRPHFEGTLAINELAHTTLLAPGGFVDELLAGTLEASMGLAARAVQTYRVDEALLPRALAARGVHDAAALPEYPYRDDALLYWNAIRGWVEAYLRAYYPSEADLAADFELAAWYRELVAQDGGRVAGLGDGASIGGLEALIDAATLVIFTSSVQHAAVNFPQFDLMTYTPNMPLGGFAPAPTSPAAGEQAFLDLLPPLSSARQQLVILYLLGTIHHTTLGLYGSDELCDPRVARPRQRFVRTLDRVGATIEARNRARPLYPFLDRRGIPQSINI